MQNLVLRELRPQYENPSLWLKEIKKDYMTIGKAQRIIRKDVSNQIVFNIIDLKDPKKIWDKLKSICTKFGY